jgi:putative DNA primase/helicase
MTDVSNPPQRQVTLADLKARAAGKWAYILEDLAPELGDAYAADGFHVACPVHGGYNGFRLFKDFPATGGTVCNTCGPHPDGFGTLAWLLEGKHKSGAFKEAVRQVAQWLDGEQTNLVLKERKPLEFKPLIDPAKAFARIAEVWKASKPVHGSVAEKYLLSRGIFAENIPKTLRFHPGLKYWDARAKKDLGTFPCLLAPIKDKENRMISIHRIFLTPEGLKAPVPDPKKMMAMCGEMRGTAIKLFSPTDTLGLAEGIETALAAYAISRMPVWSCVTAPLLEQVDIPDSVKYVVVWADKDRSERGADAAETLADRLEKLGKKVEICTPVQAIPDDQKGIDWLDVLMTHGIPGFPAKWRKWRPAIAL